VFATPKIFFSDLTDGTVTGWNGGATKGAAVSVWGYNFGSSRGTSYVTVGGVNLTSSSDYAEWGATTNPITANGQQRITFWLKPGMSLGDTTITVTTAEGTSNSIPFYTRNTGNIYFVNGDSGDDSNTGLNDTSQQWKTFEKARTIMGAGDAVYIQHVADVYDTASVTGTQWRDYVLEFADGDNKPNGTANNSVAWVAYPGDRVVIGRGLDSDNTEGFVYFLNEGNNQTNYNTFSKFEVKSYKYTFNLGSGPHDSLFINHMRIVGCDLTTTDHTGTSGHGIDIRGNADKFSLLGNYMHHNGRVDGNDQSAEKGKSIYFAGEGDITIADVGWNDFVYDRAHSQFYGHHSDDNLFTNMKENSLKLLINNYTVDISYNLIKSKLSNV